VVVLFFVGLLATALLGAGEYLPHPDDVLGDLAEPDEVDWPKEDQDISNRLPLLRETDGYMDLLLHFTKIVVMAQVFGECGHTQLLSSYMTPHLEAFLVVTYVNSYDSWKSKVVVDSSTEEEGNREQRSAGNKRSRGESSSSLPSLSSVSMTSSKKYTENARGRGKFKGWSEAGLSLYNKIVSFLEQQRANNEYGEHYETNLRLEFEKQKKNSVGDIDDNGGAGFKVKNGLDLCPDVVPPLVPMLAL
jgi:hypothetical protein